MSAAAKTTRALAVNALLAALLVASKEALAALPNIELVSALLVAYTIVYRARALVPLYLFVLIEGAIWGFAASWFVMYLYVWLVLWAGAMLLTRRRLADTPPVRLILLSSAFGLAFGTLCAPVEAFWHGVPIVPYIVAGVPFDVAHAVGNGVTAALILPIARLIFACERGKR